MKTRNLSRRGTAWARIVLLFVAAAALLVGPDINAQEPRNPPPSETACSKWSVKGMRVGMTLAELKAAHPNTKSGKKNYDRPALGDDWSRWRDAEDSRWLWHWVLPERDDDQARIVSVQAEIDLKGTTPTQVVNALVERWGAPKHREEPTVKVEYFNRYGFQGEREWPVTYWTDETCDLGVLAVEQRRKALVGPLAGSPYTRFLIYMDSLKFMSERLGEQLDAARDSVKP